MYNLSGGSNLMEIVEKWVSLEDVCDYLGVSKDTVRKMIKQYKMPAYKIDRKWKFKISEIDRWMKEYNRINGHDGEEDETV